MSFYVKHRQRVSITNSEPSKTKQSSKAECDINNIISQFKKTGIINHINASPATYTDLPPNIDYQLALNTVLAAEYAFSELPSKIRDRFGNDPSGLLAALENPAMADELRGLGILNKLPAPAPAEPSGDAS